MERRSERVTQARQRLKRTFINRVRELETTGEPKRYFTSA